MQRRNAVIISIIVLLLLATGGIWYAKQQVVKGRPADAPAITQKETSPIDLRPAAIAKLQELVQKGSDGLYRLRIDSLETDVASGTVMLKGIGLWPDSAVMHSLHAAQKLPDDVFRLELASLRISGIGLADILHSRDLHIRAVVCDGPQIEVYHKLQPYNANKRAAAKGQTLWGRMKESIDRLAIDSILVTRGAITDYSGAQKATYADVLLNLRDILIDSAAEQDASRFLFAKKAVLQAGKMQVPVGASHYDLSIGAISIAGEAKTVTVRNLALKPHGGQEAFLKGQKTQTEVYDIELPQLTLRGADWWAAAHGESLLAEDAEISGARVKVFLDQRLPPSPTIKRDNFPQQMLADAGMRVSLRKVQLQGAAVIYEEFTKLSGKQSSVSFNGINAVAEGVTNIPAEVAVHPVATLRGSCRFMNVTPMTGDFSLELPRAKKGAFKAALTMGAMGHEAVNPFSEGMGLVRFTSGQLQDGSAQIAGNNDNVHGIVAARYADLHIEPLKSKEDDEGRLKKKRITKTIANGVFVKNNNPAKGGALRRPDFSLDRTKEPNFFNFIWMGLKLGLLKTIGVPPKLGGM